MVTACGQKRFVCQFRVGARSRRMHLKTGLTLTAAKREAAKFLGDVARGIDPLAERQKAASIGADTFRAIAEDYVRREGDKLRSMKQRAAILELLVYSKLGARPIGDIRKSDIVRMLDGIEDKIGAPTADLVLAVVSRIMSWHAKRSDEFRSPIVRGMARTKQKERARQRTLSDDEIRAIWRAADHSEGVFGPYLQFLLLTGARRTEVSRMTRAEVAGDTWTIPAAGYKTGIELVLPLSPAAIAALERLPKIGAAKFVFTTDGRRPIFRLFEGEGEVRSRMRRDGMDAA